MNCTPFTLVTARGEKALELRCERVFAIGYAGRDLDKTRAHIRELHDRLGVPEPKKIPTIFQCSPYVLTRENNIDVVGRRTCGEAEYVILRQGGRLYIGLGSDHTDRDLEAVNVLKAKQICAKPIGPVLWDYEELKDHWDGIRLLSWQTADGREKAYQEGTLGDILPAETILSELESRVGEIGDCAVFSGTVPLLGGFVFGDAFRCEMRDEVLGRTLSLEYRVRVIPEEER